MQDWVASLHNRIVRVLFHRKFCWYQEIPGLDWSQRIPTRDKSPSHPTSWADQTSHSSPTLLMELESAAATPAAGDEGSRHERVPWWVSVECKAYTLQGQGRKSQVVMDACLR